VSTSIEKVDSGVVVTLTNPASLIAPYSSVLKSSNAWGVITGAALGATPALRDCRAGGGGAAGAGGSLATAGDGVGGAGSGSSVVVQPATVKRAATSRPAQNGDLIGSLLVVRG
jgi:hypothetical protein